MKGEIVQLKSDIERGFRDILEIIQSIIFARFAIMFMYGMDMLLAKYSLGNHPDTMIDDYLDNITYLENCGEEEAGYINLLWMVGLGILLEMDKEVLKRLARVIERQRIEDALMDFLLKACDETSLQTSQAFAPNAIAASFWALGTRRSVLRLW